MGQKTSFFSSLAGSTSATAEAEATRDDDYVTVYRGTDNSMENMIYQEIGHLLSDAARTSYYSNSYSMEQHEALATAYKDAFEAHTKWLQIFGSESKYAIEHSKKGTELSQQYNLDRTLISVTTDKSVAQRFANGETIYSARVPKILFNTHFIKQPLATSTESEYLMRLGSAHIQFTPIQ